MLKELKKTWFEIIVAIALVCAVGAIISLKYSYLIDSNDDMLLREIVSGRYTGTPEPRLIYIMYPLGVLLCGLYRCCPQIEWYDWFMTLGHYLCWIFVLIRTGMMFSSKKKKLCGILFAFLLILCIDFQFLLMHQYTILASWMGIVSLIWLITMKNKQLKADPVICIVFALLCLWVRKEVFFMLLPLCILAIIYNYFPFKKIQVRKQYKKALVPALIIMALFIGSFILELFAYRAQTWKEYKEFNQARTQVYDYYGLPPYSEYAEEYTKLGISESELVALQYYNLGLDGEMSTERMTSLAQMGKDYHDWQEQYYSTYRKTLYAVCNQFLYHSTQPIGFFLITVFIGTLVYFITQRKQKEAIVVCFTIVYLILFTAFFLWKGRFPQRVEFGLLLSIFLFNVFMFLNELQLREEEIPKLLSHKDIMKKHISQFLCCLCAFFVIGNLALYVYRTVSDNYQNRVASLSNWEGLEEYFEEHSDLVFFLSSSSYACIGDKMLCPKNNGIKNAVLLGSWLSLSPLQEQHLDNIDVSVISEDLVVNEKYVFVQLAEEDVEWIKKLYLDRQTEIQIVEQQADDIEGLGYHIYTIDIK